ncbi:MAG: MlaD family protein [Candidatus Latescibacterota bacterium]|jgi:phospholipid/cholesterol/gamma-HCH transport system substrate-binding protein
MASRAQKIRLAVFFLVASGLLLLFLLAVGGSHLVGSRDLYTIQFRGVSVGGLTEGAQVKYQGIAVGRVERIYVSPQDITAIVVEITVEPAKVSNAIRRDTQAAISNLGITGLKYIELIAGSQQSEPLPPGSQIPTSASFLSRLEERADVITNKMEQALDRINELLAPANQQEFARLMTRAADLTEHLDQVVQENRQPLGQAAVNLALASQHLAGSAITLDATMDSLRGLLTGRKLQSTVGNMQVVSQQLRQQMEGPVPQLIANLNTTVANIDETFAHIDQTLGATRTNILRAMQDLEETLQNVRETTEIVRDNPSVLIRGGGRTSE